MSSLVNIVNLNYDSLFELAVNLKDKHPNLKDWDIENENDPLRVILDAYLLSIEKLGKYSNNVAQEFSLATAITRDTVVSKAFFAGYVVNSRLAAVGELDIEFSAGNPVTIEPNELIISGQAENGEKIYVENRNAIVLGPTTETKQGVEFEEGRTYNLTYTGKEDKFETYLIQDTIIDGSIRLFVNEVEWSEVFRINDAYSSSSQVFTVREVGDQVFQISVGNGINGSLIQEGASVELRYRRGAGVLGNQPAEIFKRVEVSPTNRINTIFPVEDSPKFNGGVDQEDIEKIRTYAPLLPKLGDRIANPFDMDVFVNSYPGIGRGKTASLAGNSVIVYVIGQNGEVSDTLKNELLSEIRSSLIFNIGTTVQEASLVPVSIVLDIIYTSQFRAQDIENEIRSNIINFLNPFAKDEAGEFLLEFGSDLLISDVIELTKKVDGVLAAAIKSPVPYSNQILIQVADNEILTSENSVININLTRVEASDIGNQKTDKYLFTNPKNRVV